ncbi:sigma-70 family RNA polymerase sigma factor [bacterium]|nr:sigma-70 family RNA polymerase sigma factor [candidate division CSSED10-310 bacterium]
MNELVQRAGEGDVKARQELIELLTPRLEKIVRKYQWISGMDKDDLKQEVYMAVIEGLDRVDITIGSSSEYLLKFARWRLLDCLKKILRHRCGENFETQESHVEDMCNVNAAMTAEMELLDNRMTEIQKQILHAVAAGYTWREIGDQMGFTAANVAHHLKQIRKIYG